MLFHAGAPSLTDYANWAYQGVLLRDHLLGRPDASHVLKRYPVPNSAATLGVGLMALALPWMMAAKLWLCVQFALSWVCLRHLLRTVRGGTAAWVICVQAVFLNVNLWYGFVNFELGICWTMLMTSLLLRRVQRDEGREWVLGLLLVVAFFTHMIPFAVCGLLLVLYAWQTRRWGMLWQLTPSVALSAWYVMGRFLVARDADGQTGMLATAKTYSAAFWAFKGNSYVKSFGFTNPLGLDGDVFGLWGLWGLLILAGVLAGISAVALVKGAMSGLRAGTGERFVWVGLMVLTPVYLLAPGTALGVSDPGARVLQAGLGVGLALCWRGVTGWAQKLAAGCAFVLSLAGLWLFISYGGALGHPLILGPEAGRGVARFAHVPSTDQDYFYGAMERGDMGVKVFPTGMFLNR